MTEYWTFSASPSPVVVKIDNRRMIGYATAPYQTVRALEEAGCLHILFE